MKINKELRVSRRSLTLIGSAVILTWLVLSRSFVAYLADAAPSTAWWIDPDQPKALLNLANEAFAQAATGQDISDASEGKVRHDKSTSGEVATPSAKTTISDGAVDRAFLQFESIGDNRSISRPLPPDNVSTVRGWAESAIRNEPVNAQAFQLLGRLAEAEGDDKAAFRFMDAAERLSLHQSLATYWLLRTSTHARDYAVAVRSADVLLRTDPQSYRYVVPFLAEVIQNKSGAALVEKVLATDPPWRADFIATLPNDVTDARVPLNLLLALRTDPKPPQMSDIVPYLDFLVQHRFYALAYYTWLQFLSPSELHHVGYIFNGGFEASPSGAPFDWKISQGTGVTVDIVARPDGADQRALMLDFEFGRVDYHSVAELVVLPPGTYQFSGEYQGKLVGPRGLKWRIACAEGKIAPVAESAMISGTTRGWKNVAFTFSVPDKDCSAQYVRLDLDARMASEELVSGTIYFDRLQISRAAQPAPGG